MPDENVLRCMAHVWALSNFIDGVTDTFYGGAMPTEGQFDEIVSELTELSNTCAPQELSASMQTVTQALQLAREGNRDKAFQLMGQARRQISDIMGRWRS